MRKLAPTGRQTTPAGAPRPVGPRCRALRGRGRPPPVPGCRRPWWSRLIPVGAVQFHPRPQFGGGGHGGLGPGGSHRAHDLTLEALMARCPFHLAWPQAPMPRTEVVRLPHVHLRWCVLPRWKCQLLPGDPLPLSCVGAGSPSPSRGAQPCGVTPLCAVVLAHPPVEARPWAVGCPGAGAPRVC